MTRRGPLTDEQIAASLEHSREKVRCGPLTERTMTSEEKLAREAIHRKVSDQFDKFLVELPALMPTNADQWCVYLDGPKMFFSDEGEAYAWAIKNLGMDAGFVLAQVAKQRPVWISPFWISNR